jgi:hypothetical protein
MLSLGMDIIDADLFSLNEEGERKQLTKGLDIVYPGSCQTFCGPSNRAAKIDNNMG